MNTLRVGSRVKLREGVLHGPMFEMNVTRVFKNGWAEARSDDRRCRVKVRHGDFIIKPDPNSCWCGVCQNDFDRALNDWDDTAWWQNLHFMILCPDCGCKRCPRASFHEHACTGSNEPGQDGSVYGDFQLDTDWMDLDTDWLESDDA